MSLKGEITMKKQNIEYNKAFDFYNKCLKLD